MFMVMPVSFVEQTQMNVRDFYQTIDLSITDYTAALDKAAVLLYNM